MAARARKKISRFLAEMNYKVDGDTKSDASQNGLLAEKPKLIDRLRNKTQAAISARTFFLFAACCI